MSPAVRDLMSAAAAVLRNCRPRYTRDEESYFDELASALSDMEGEAAGPVVVTSDAHVVTCRCCGEELDVDTDFDTLSASGRHMVLTLTCSHERETDVRYVLASEAAGPVDIDEPVGTTADTVTPLVADPDCQWCAGAGYVHGDPDLGCPACDERQVIVDAFRAGAEYMRRSAHLVTSRVRLYEDEDLHPRIVMPDEQRIADAAIGYVSVLGAAADVVPAGWVKGEFPGLEHPEHGVISTLSGSLEVDARFYRSRAEACEYLLRREGDRR